LRKSGRGRKQVATKEQDMSYSAPPRISRTFSHAVALVALIAAAPAWSQDTTPEAFTFNDQTGAEPSAMVESNTITVTGIDAAAAISVTGGEYRIGAGAYTSNAGTVTYNQMVQARATAGAFGATVDVVLSIGGVSDTFSVTSRNANSDTVLDAGGRVVSVGTNTGTLLNLRLVSPSVYASSAYQYPNGFFAFDVDVAAPGDTAIVTMTLPAGAEPTVYVKCSNSACALFGGVSFAGEVVTLTLTDGGAGDMDNLADGVISDPGAPGILVPYSGGGGGYSSGGGYGGSPGGLTILVGLALGLLRRRDAKAGS